MSFSLLLLLIQKLLRTKWNPTSSSSASFKTRPANSAADQTGSCFNVRGPRQKTYKQPDLSLRVEFLIAHYKLFSLENILPPQMFIDAGPAVSGRRHGYGCAHQSSEGATGWVWRLTQVREPGTDESGELSRRDNQLTSGMQKSRDTRTEADKLNVEDKPAAQKKEKKRRRHCQSNQWCSLRDMQVYTVLPVESIPNYRKTTKKNVQRYLSDLLESQPLL